MQKTKIRVKDIRPGDVMCGTGNVVARVERRNRRKRTDRPVRSAGAGIQKARVTVIYENGARFPRDPDEITFVMRAS